MSASVFSSQCFAKKRSKENQQRKPAHHAEEQEEDSLDSVDLFDEKPQQQFSLVQAARNAKAKKHK